MMQQKESQTAIFLGSTSSVRIMQSRLGSFGDFEWLFYLQNMRSGRTEGGIMGMTYALKLP